MVTLTESTDQAGVLPAFLCVFHQREINHVGFRLRTGHYGRFRRHRRDAGTGSCSMTEKLYRVTFVDSGIKTTHDFVAESWEAALVMAVNDCLPTEHVSRVEFIKDLT